jgi:hypothetical protein
MVVYLVAIFGKDSARIRQVSVIDGMDFEQLAKANQVPIIRSAAGVNDASILGAKT